MNSYSESDTILVFSLSGSPDEMKAQLKIAEADVTEKVNQIAAEVEPGTRWCDPDFGPNSKDPKGAKSLYRAGRRPRYSLPDHNTLVWQRPNYHGEYTKLKTNVYCEEASLFKDGHCSGDVIQGQLGDCWFISALAMMANETALLDNIFFAGGRRLKQYPDLMNPIWVEAGIWVCRFVSQENFIYVIIDDQLPVSLKEKTKLVFGRCEDISELWVPLAEKALAKLFLSYDSLTGGFSQIALRDLTGLCPEAIDINNTKVASPYVNDKLLNYLYNRLGSSSLLGASCNNPGGSGEGKGAQGLITGHAYSLLGVLPLETSEQGKVDLVVLRNPWGSGEWTGKWSDKCPMMKKYRDSIKELWEKRPKHISKNIFSRGRGKNAGEDKTMFDEEDNGVFCMDFKDFQKNFSEVIAAVDFPEHYRGRRVIGEWGKENSGGNSSLPTWRINPAFKLTIPKDNTHVFIVLDQEDKRAQHGINFPDHLYAIAFRLVPSTFNFAKAGAMPTKLVPNAVDNVTQMSFGYTESCSIELVMKKGEVFIVPSTYKVGEYGKFSLSVYCDDDTFELENSAIIGQEEHVEGHEFGWRIGKMKGGLGSKGGRGGKGGKGGFGSRLTQGMKGGNNTEQEEKIKKRGNRGVHLKFDPEKYCESRLKLQELVRAAGHEPNEVALQYKNLPPEENVIIKSSDFKAELAKYGVDPNDITKDILHNIKGLDRKLSKGDFYEIFHDEKVVGFRFECTKDDIIPDEEV